MKIFRKVLYGLLVLLSVLALVSCGDKNDTEDTAKTDDTVIKNETAETNETIEKTPEIVKFTVSFDSQDGSAVASQEVEQGKFATKPADPTKDNFSFIGWFKDANAENPFDFDTDAINQNTTVYAGWLDSSSSDVTTAKFYFNYEGAEKEYESVVFADGGRISKPSDPTREGYAFDGWFTADGTAYAKSTKYTGNQAFYAKWLKIYTLEAENTQLVGLTYSFELDGVVSQTGNKKGSNFSGNVEGKNLVRTDENASGGKFVWGCLNLEEGYLDFEFTADKADDAAQLNIVLSGEFWGFTLTPDTFKVLVNPEDNEDDSVSYKDIDLTWVETSTSSTTHPTWMNVYINTIEIKEGKNLIRLLVNNSNANTVGTIKAQGPIVDCITIKTTSEIDMITYDNN